MRRQVIGVQAFIHGGENVFHFYDDGGGDRGGVFGDSSFSTYDSTVQEQAAKILDEFRKRARPDEKTGRDQKKRDPGFDRDR